MDYMDPDELQEKQQEAIEKSMMQRENDLRKLLDSNHGRRFIQALLVETGTFDNTFTGNSKSYYNDGRRSIGLDLFREIMDLDPTYFGRMWSDYKAAVDLTAKINESGD